MRRICDRPKPKPFEYAGAPQEKSGNADGNDRTPNKKKVARHRPFEIKSGAPIVREQVGRAKNNEQESRLLHQECCPKKQAARKNESRRLSICRSQKKDGPSDGEQNNEMGCVSRRAEHMGHQ